MTADISLKTSTDMRVVSSGLPRTNDQRMTVGDLVSRMNALYPPADAEPWDKTGLLVGDMDIPLERICVTLDVTLDAIRETAKQGAQVLLTHHPAYLSLDTITADPRNSVPGAYVYEAASRGVNLVNYHTALDSSLDAQSMLPSMIHAQFEQVLVPIRARDQKTNQVKGYGQICAFAADDMQTLSTLSARCVSVFGRLPRIWDGNSGEYFTRVATWTGSCDEEAVDRCLEEHVPVLICGEIKYHTALEAQQKGLTVIELGHDVSENPYGLVLARAARECGVPAEAISLIQTDAHWYNPETRRV